MVSIEKEGYEMENVAVLNSVGGAVAGNIIAGGLVGWGVDAMSGAQYNLHPETINVRLREKTQTSAAGPGSTLKTKEFVDELNKLDQLLEEQKISPDEYKRMRASLIERYQK